MPASAARSARSPMVCSPSAHYQGVRQCLSPRLVWACYFPPRQEILMADPRDVVYAAIHSAFVKYPREDDPASQDQWIGPEEAAHLTKVVLAELDANGLQIVRK